jgi:23S rRNA pseudouridine2605 synthase
MRLQKILAHAGVASRRDAEKLILEGRVQVNGEVVKELGASADPEKDVILVDGERIRLKKFVYILLHKPAGVVSTLEDPEGRATLLDILPDIGKRVFPAGRLDYDSTGLVLLTNDGDLAQALAHPSKKMHKTYLVKVKGEPDEKDLTRLRKGVRLDDGARTLPAKVKITEVNLPGKSVSKNTWLKFIIHEGRNRQIKRMCLVIRHPALRVHRVAIGPLKLGDLPAGAWRYATKDEEKALKELKK